MAEWLKSLNFEQYIDPFLAEGFDSMSLVQNVGDADLITLGVKRIHRKLILARLKALGDSPKAEGVHLVTERHWLPTLSAGNEWMAHA